MADVSAIPIKGAAQRLGVSESTFRRHVLPNLSVIRPSPQTVRVPVAELERWVKQNATRE